MGRDILDFTANVPVERLGLPPETHSPRRRPQTTDTPAADWERPETVNKPGAELAVPPTPSDTAGGRSLNLLVVGLGLVLAAAAGYYFWSTAGRAEVAFNDLDIANAADVLAAAEAEVLRVAEADGAPLGPEAACYFAPSRSALAPSVLCGPVWLGVSPDDQPWLDVRVNYTIDPGDGQQVAIGEVAGVNSPAAGDPDDFVRLDGRAAPQPDGPARSTIGPRLRGGELVLSPDDVLVEAEKLMADAIANPDPDRSAFVPADDWRCFFLEGPDQVGGIVVTDSSTWCGPVRTATSRADEVWLPVNIIWQQGPTFGTRVVEEARLVGSVRAVPEGAVLTRPDGVTAADADSVNRPPAAVDFAESFDFRLPVEPLVLSADGPTATVATERQRVQFDGLARTDEVGSGARFVAAPDGHDLVVATMAANEGRVNMNGVLLVDGVERELPRWPSLDEGGSLVIVVPEDASAVDLMVDNDGRPQTLSLLDGTLEPGFPLALYRDVVEPDVSFFSRADMPVGDPVTVEGTVSEITWEARDEESNWLPAGISDLLVNVDGWRVDRPCCDVNVDGFSLNVTLIGRSDGTDRPEDSESEDSESDPGETGSRYEDRRAEPSERPGPFDPFRFRVPEDLTSATLRIEISYDVEQDGQSQVVKDVVEVDLELS